MEITKIAIYVLVGLIILAYIIWQIVKNGLRQTCVDLIVRAEKTLHDNQEKFDKWHEFACKRLITFSNDILTYGQAQKWINMTLKNLSMIDHRIYLKLLLLHLLI